MPGFVDLQCNGGLGVDLTTEPERWLELARWLPTTGVTSFLPTVVTTSARTGLVHSTSSAPTSSDLARGAESRTPGWLDSSGCT
ncbi:MAG: hypothetical protein R2715_12120 [Ilumatobacteraceae bacterium]